MRDCNIYLNLAHVHQTYQFSELMQSNKLYVNILTLKLAQDIV